MGLFKKAGIFTDIHFGKKSDSELHNQDCLRYIDWFCGKVQEHDCDTIIFMGDWFDNRARLRVDTKWYSYRGIEKIASLGKPIYWLVGNHDLFFKDSRDVHSLPYLKMAENIHIINQLHHENDVLFCPWLVGDEFTTPPDTECKYIFGHFELPLFLVNEMVEMPDYGGLHMNHFYQCEAVFSGHFHKRQVKVNDHGIPVCYIGNCFPHNFNDEGDRERGCAILEWGEDPQFLNWEDAPNYNRLPLSRLLKIVEDDQFDEKYNKYSVLECKDDIGIEIEQMLEIKELVQEHVRSITIFPAVEQTSIEDETELGETQNVDQMVVDHLNKLDTEGSDYDVDLLVRLYKNIGDE